MRTGVLSDQAIKERSPEFFPLDIGNQEFLHPIHMDKHIFKGIKGTKKYRTTIARFPINDLKNFATFGSPLNRERAEFNAIMNYRKELGSTNFSENLETAFDNRLKQTYQPILPKPAEHGAGGVQTGLTLSLGRFNRKEGQDVYSQVVTGSRNYISARMRGALSNLVPKDELLNLNELFAPSGFNPRHGRLSDSYILNRLQNEYRDDPEQLNLIERAYTAAGRQNLLPIQMTRPEEEQLEDIDE